jgi:hypothetical protein
MSLRLYFFCRRSYRKSNINLEIEETTLTWRHGERRAFFKKQARCSEQRACYVLSQHMEVHRTLT